MLSWTTWSILTLGLLGIWLLIRYHTSVNCCNPPTAQLLATQLTCLYLLCCSYVSQKVKQKLLKAGVTLSYRSLSLSSISGVQLQLTKVSRCSDYGCCHVPCPNSLCSRQLTDQIC
jgi:hypothetical protein